MGWESFQIIEGHGYLDLLWLIIIADSLIKIPEPSGAVPMYLLWGRV